MKKKIVWLLVSCLMVVALVLASCAPVAVEEEEEGAPALATIKLGATSSTWREGEEPYDIYSAIKEKLEKYFTLLASVV